MEENISETQRFLNPVAPARPESLSKAVNLVDDMRAWHADGSVDHQYGFATGDDESGNICCMQQIDKTIHSPADISSAEKASVAANCPISAAGDEELGNISCMQPFPAEDYSTNPQQIDKTIHSQANISSAEPETASMAANCPASDNCTDSALEKKQNRRKSKNAGIDLNKKQRQKIRVKKYWPKILDESKPKKIPKSAKKMREIPISEKKMCKTAKSEKKTSKEMMRENILKSDNSPLSSPLAHVPQTPEPSSPKRIITSSWEKCIPISCEKCESSRSVITEHATRRALHFNLEDQVKEGDDLNAEAKISQHQFDKRLKSSPSDFNLNLPAQDFDSCLEMRKIISEYHRRKGKQASSNTSTLELQLKDFPKTCKKRRMRRRKATVYRCFLGATYSHLLPIFPRIPSRKKRSKRSNRFSSLKQSQSSVKEPKLVNEALLRKLKPPSSVKQCKVYTRRNKLQVKSSLSSEVPNIESQQVPLQSQDNMLLGQDCSVENFVGVGHQQEYETLQQEDVAGDFELCHKDDASNEASGDLLTLQLERTDEYESRQVVVLDQCAGGALVPYKGKAMKQPSPLNVDLDLETMTAWEVLMENEGSGVTEETDKEKERWWSNEREIFKGRVDLFINLMNHIQGNRCFTPWKGSVVDSVVGVFLTQNVADYLSSNAFMSLASKYPVQSKPKTVHGNEDIAFSQESVGNNPIQPQHNNLGGDEDKPSSQEPVGSNPIQFEKNTHRGEENIRFSQKLFGTVVETEGQTNSNIHPGSNKNKQGQRTNKDTSGHESTSGTNSRKKKMKLVKEEENSVDWDDLRTVYSRNKPRKANTQDSVDWEAVRLAEVKEVADVIKQRGMNNHLAARIKEFLDRIVKDHGSIDLEWLRDVPPDKAKKYLLSIKGLGLKSVECLRLLTLHHHAFPVDTNVGRLAVRLGWVPLQPLPGDVQFHLLDLYPLVDKVQKYLWPRLCTLDQKLLYQLHYHMITFGKVFCSKRKPNCNVCPLTRECRHFSSAVASTRFCLPGPQEKGTVRTNATYAADQDPSWHIPPPEFLLLDDIFSKSGYESQSCEPIVEYPASPEPSSMEFQLEDVEDIGCDSDGEIHIIRLSNEELKRKVSNFMEKKTFMSQDHDISSKALVALTPYAVSIHRPKLKSVSRLRTTHHVCELPDTHALVAELDKREPDDPCPYLLAIWVTGTTMHNSNSENNVVEEQNDHTVYGTILIPCRTATRGCFPLNGTYFQVNEVFADDESSQNPIRVPRSEVWNLQRRSLYCGTSASYIFRGLPLAEIRHCFLEGFICVRGFHRQTRAPKTLSSRFHETSTRKLKEDL